jgi:hypothetical protein
MLLFAFKLNGGGGMSLMSPVELFLYFTFHLTFLCVVMGQVTNSDEIHVPHLLILFCFGRRTCVCVCHARAIFRF